MERQLLPIDVQKQHNVQEFVTTIANMTMDGEDINGEEFDMTNDDAVDALNGIIEWARRLTSRNDA